MKPLFKKCLFSLATFCFCLGGLELLLKELGYEGTSIVDLVDTSGFHENAYVHRRDRILGDWYIKKGELYHSNPELLSRGFHNNTFQSSDNIIYAIGGSTTYGSPFEHQEKGFSERLEKLLKGKHKIINTGVAGMDSSSFPSLAKQLSSIGGHGVIIYTGNNELQGALLRKCATPPSQFQRFKMYQLILDLQRRYHNTQYQFNALAEHQEDCIDRALLETLKQSPADVSSIRSDPFYETLKHTFRENLLQSIERFREAGLHIWLVIPPINLLERPTFSIPDPALSPEDRLSVLMYSKEKRWAEILRIDPNHAQANYEIGRIPPYDFNKLRIAAERDYRSRRLTWGLQDILLQLCKERDVVCVDLRDQEKKSELFFHDFCHPTQQYGVQTIAQALYTHIIGSK